VTDTLGRTVKFKYVDLLVGSVSKKVLVAVTAPGFDDGSPDDRVVARFACRVQNATIERLRAIYYPATGTGYWFGDSDSYSNYGMLRRVSERRGMVCSNPESTTAEALITSAGVMSREMVYSHTTQPGYSAVTGTLSDAPTYDRLTEDWYGRAADVLKPVTEYAVTNNGLTLSTKITRRDENTTDGLTTEQITDNNQNSETYGLLLEDKTFPDKNSQTVLHKSKVYWEVPNQSLYPTTNGAPRPQRTEVTDERNQKVTAGHRAGAAAPTRLIRTGFRA
jgi:hypothetical protein